MTSRPSTAAPILAVLAVVLVTLGAYVGGYFWLGEFTANTDDHAFVCRSYPHDWKRVAYKPAG
jgi:hypothetical protein